MTEKPDTLAEAAYQAAVVLCDARGFLLGTAAQNLSGDERRRLPKAINDAADFVQRGGLVGEALFLAVAGHTCPEGASGWGHAPVAVRMGFDAFGRVLRALDLVRLAHAPAVAPAPVDRGPPPRIEDTIMAQRPSIFETASYAMATQPLPAGVTFNPPQPETSKALAIETAPAADPPATTEAGSAE